MITQEEKIRKLVNDFSDICNCCCGDDMAKWMADEFIHQHNTLQQSMLGVIKNAIIYVVKYEYLPVDARNEASIEWCKKVAEISHNRRFPFI